MSIVNEAISQLEQNKSKRENGDVIAIPWQLSRLSSVLPGIVQRHFTIITANQKVGNVNKNSYLCIYEYKETNRKNRIFKKYSS